MPIYDICIVGGGASGLAAAITAKKNNSNLSVLLLEKKEKTGKKILASGNGKCNLSNTAADGYRENTAFFSDLGLVMRKDAEGRVYPVSEESSAVRHCLMREIEQLDVVVKTNAPVQAIEKEDHLFSIKGIGFCEEAKKVLLACGGKSGPEFGTSGDGYKWAKEFGHEVNKPIPALTAVETKEEVSSLAGVRVKGISKLAYKGTVIFEEKGEIQFTKTGVSGICIFNLSRFLLIPEGKSVKDGFDDYTVSLDLYPEGKNLAELFNQRRGRYSGRELLCSMVKEPLCRYIDHITKGDNEKIAYMLHNFELHPKGVRGWDFAQVTKGGVALEDVDLFTMESKKVPGIYFAGELLDFDGPCGGFNLDFAWMTGQRAGKGMSRV